jgi:uncharacterized protein
MLFRDLAGSPVDNPPRDTLLRHKGARTLTASNQPANPWRSFFLTVIIGWIILAGAGVYLARAKGIAPGLAAPVVAAFLLEYLFYLVPGFEGLRDWLADKIPVRSLASAFALSALAPYLLYSLPTGQFRPDMAIRLVALVVAVCFWFVWRSPTPTADLTFLAMIAAALVLKFFKHVYTSPFPQQPVYILGQLMLLRLVASVMLTIREVEGTGFGFLPTFREWRIGARYYAYFLPVGLALMYALGLAHFRHFDWMTFATAPLKFLGILWVVALLEEFLARGLLQHWISDWTGHPNFALAFASLAFGLSHLWYGAFPNWRFAIVVSAAGWFYGKAYNAGGGIRASMVAHALVVTTQYTLFS